MATTWSPKTRLEPRSWLLTNGEVVQEPALEETPSGRKVRVAGATDSVYASDLDNLLTRAVATIAAQKKTDVWMPLHGAEAQIRQKLGYKPSEQKAILHVVHDAGNRYGKTHVWWRFKHPELPIEVVLTLDASAQYSYNGTKPQTLAGRLVMPYLVTQRGVEAGAYAEEEVDWSDTQNLLGTYDERLALREFTRDNPADWPVGEILGSGHFMNERLMVEALLKRVRKADDLVTIQVPDLRDMSNLGWLTLDLFDTNCNDAFIAELADYLDGTPAVDEALKAYRNMLAALRAAGIVLEDKEDNDFLAALVSGDKALLSVQVQYPAEEGHLRDNEHKLSLHLPSGTFIVECNHRKTNKDEIAEKWEEALTVAQFTGQEDTLLAYAREYSRTQNERRTKAILKERKTGESA